MNVFFTKGDLFAYSNLQSFAHGCNCRGAMGKGIALEFKKRFPLMYSQYKKLCERGEFNLGSVFVYKEDAFTVFDIGTQISWGVKAEISAIEIGLSSMLELAKTYGVTKIGLPRLGAGLGGLDWKDVKPVVKRICEPSDIEVIVFEEFLRA